MPGADNADHDDHRDDGKGDEAAASDPALQGLPAVRQSVSCNPDSRRPHERAGRVVRQKLRPAQAARASAAPASSAVSPGTGRPAFSRNTPANTTAYP